MTDMSDNKLRSTIYFIMVFVSALMLGFFIYKAYPRISHMAHKTYARFSHKGAIITYFKDVNLESVVARDAAIELFIDYHGQPPARGVPASGFSARWEGLLNIPTTTNYSFFSQSDDGLRFYLDDDLIIENWKDNDWYSSGTHAERFLKKGTYRLTVEHYFKQGNAALRIRWAGGPVPDNSIIGAPYLRKHVTP